MAPALEAHIAKYRSLMPSLALLFELIDTEGLPVSVGKTAALRAVAWCGNLAIQALHICVVSLAESVRIMELVYPIPMRFTDSGKPLWARFSATGGTDMCKGSMAKFVLQM